MTRRVRAFGYFWWDFLLGDAPELAAGALVILLIAWGAKSLGVGDAILVPVGVGAVLTGSTIRGRAK